MEVLLLWRGSFASESLRTPALRLPKVHTGLKLVVASNQKVSEKVSKNACRPLYSSRTGLLGSCLVPTYRNIISYYHNVVVEVDDSVTLSEIVGRLCQIFTMHLRENHH